MVVQFYDALTSSVPFKAQKMKITVFLVLKRQTEP